MDLELHMEVELQYLDNELEDIESLDNIAQLELLIKEINLIGEYKLHMTPGWYEDRIKYIHTYSQLDWDQLIHEFKVTNLVLSAKCLQIKSAITSLISKYTVGFFELDLYAYILNNVRSVWIYYRNTYIGDDYDMEDLLVDLTNFEP